MFHDVDFFCEIVHSNIFIIMGFKIELSSQTSKALLELFSRQLWIIVIKRCEEWAQWDNLTAGRGGPSPPARSLQQQTQTHWKRRKQKRMESGKGGPPWTRWRRRRGRPSPSCSISSRPGSEREQFLRRYKVFVHVDVLCPLNKLVWWLKLEEPMEFGNCQFCQIFPRKYNLWSFMNSVEIVQYPLRIESGFWNLYPSLIFSLYSSRVF